MVWPFQNATTLVTWDGLTWIQILSKLAVLISTHLFAFCAVVALGACTAVFGVVGCVALDAFIAFIAFIVFGAFMTLGAVAFAISSWPLLKGAD